MNKTHYSDIIKEIKYDFLSRKDIIAMMKEIETNFKNWICQHQDKAYTITILSDEVIELHTHFGKATITFTEVDDSMIIEFSVISKKDDSTRFYLHFELNDENHAKKLYEEMIESLLDLQNEKNIKVLLSCSSGLTTAMFAQQLNATAQSLNINYHFEAVSYMSIYEEVSQYDIVVLAPQIGYMLKKIKESLPDKLVLQIPTAIFGTYDAMAAIQFIQKEEEQYNQQKIQTVQEKKQQCLEYEKRILSIVIVNNKAQSRTYYRLSEKCEVMDSHLIIKASMNINDLYDIIDTLLLKHSYIDIISIAVPGIVNDHKILKYQAFSENPIDMKQKFQEKYHIPVYVTNNNNAAVVGFALQHPEYHNILFHSQPFGYGIGGQAIIANDQLIIGKNGIAGEIKFFLPRMQFSDEYHKLAWNHLGALELVTKSLIPSICLYGPDVIVVFSPMTPDMKELKLSLQNFIPEEYLPELIDVKDVHLLMLDGVTKLCGDHYHN